MHVFKAIKGEKMKLITSFLIDTLLLIGIISSLLIIGYLVGKDVHSRSIDYPNYKDGNICLARYNGSIVPFTCEDSTIESK